MLNITCDMLPNEVIKVSHSATAVPSLILLYLAVGIALFVSALFTKQKGSGWGNFILFWFITMFLLGLILLFLVFFPLTIQSIKDFIVNLF